MKDLLEISCGLDVHKDQIVACILTGPLSKPTHSEIREFTTLIPDMIALRDWIVSQNCRHVAMERTGVYWMPVYETLEDAFVGEITLLIVNARHMKNVPGKKTDVRDSVVETVTVRASSVILHSRKTGLKNFYKAPVFVCLPLFLIYLVLLAGTSCYT